MGNRTTSWSRLQRRLSAILASALVLGLLSPQAANAASMREASVQVSGGWNDWVTSVAVDSGSPSRVFCSTAYLSDPPGSTYRSYDRGASWTPLGSGVPAALLLGSVTLESAGSTLLAAPSVGTSGIYRSTNAGASWSALTTWADGDRVRDIVVDPSDDQRIFSVTEQSSETPPNLRYSVDGGSTWSVREISVPANACRVALSVEIATGGRLLVGGENVYWISGPTGGGVFASDDLGVSWTRTGCLDLNVSDLAVCPTDRDVVYACARQFGGQGVLYKSTDAGDTFVPVSMPASASANTVEVDSLGRVFVGSQSGFTGPGGLHQSDDGGLTWTQVGAFTGDQGIYASDLDPAGCFLYAGVSGGISRYWLPSAEEVFGANRFQTAIQVSRTRFPDSDSAGAVVVVSGVAFPDAAVAGPFADSRNGTILLSGPKGLDSATLLEIDRLLPTGGDVYVIGGVRAVPDSVDTVLANRGYDVTRVGGDDRYATSAAVAALFGAPTAVFLASGKAFPDALSASAPAADLGIPILLTRENEIPEPVASYLSAKEAWLETAYIAGDTTVVGPAVGSELSNWVSSVVQLGGSTRYDTSLAIAAYFYPVPSAAAGIATGQSYPDALTGSILCALRGGPLLLTPANDLPSSTASYLASGMPSTLTVFGGRKAISLEARGELEALW